MRQEITNWLEQSLNDLEKAEVLFKSRNFDGTAFFCQQAVEKALKSFSGNQNHQARHIA